MTNWPVRSILLAGLLPGLFWVQEKWCVVWYKYQGNRPLPEVWQVDDIKLEERGAVYNNLPWNEFENDHGIHLQEPKDEDLSLASQITNPGYHK